MEEKKLFLLDAYALIYRAYYALLRSPRVTSSGMNTSAIFGFVNTLEDLLKKEDPGYIAVCFDPPHGKTFRHEQYPEYKAGRDKQPEDITIAIPYIKRILAAYRIPVLEMEGYEADDIIGTLSRIAETEGFTTYMMTPDKDYGQLVTDRVFMYRPALKGMGFEVRGPQQVCERYGISNTRQVIDLLALEGDASDNVPGCPGVGEKTAVKLINEFGSVENLLANTDALKGALKQKISDNADQIRMSKELVTIDTHVPVTFDPDDLRRCEPDTAALIDIYRELEFKSFITKLGGVPLDRPVASPVPTSLFDFDYDAKPIVVEESCTINIIPCKTEQEIAGFINTFADDVAMIVNAPSADAMTAKVASITFAIKKGNTIDCATISMLPGVADLLQPVFANKAITLVSPDVKRDIITLRRAGLHFDGAHFFDTSVAHYLCAPEQRHDLANLASSYLSLDLTDASEADKAAAVLRLKPVLTKEAEEKDQAALLFDVEFPMVEVLADMEWNGVRIDPNELHRLSKQLTARLRDLEAEAYAIAGRPFNVSSPAQVGQILFGELQIDPKAKKTKGGAWSTAEDVLEKYAADVPLVRLILDIRGLKKLLATYVDALPRLINPATGKIHTTYNQTVTATGRLSSTNPNLQNIPIRTDDGREIRRAFIADPDCLLLSADYSQIELRLMADLSADPVMVEAFLSGEDIHRSTAAKIYHLDPTDVTDTQRRNAKTANFGIIYGISAFGLSERLSIPRAEAKQLIDGYLATYPRVAEYMNESIERAREKGYVTTTLGRRRYLPDITSRSNTVRSYAERNAINAPLQGSAADIIKVAMVDIHRQIKARGLKSKMILQVHDELVFNVVPDELAELQQLVVTSMAAAYHGTVPLEVAAGVATNWLDAH